MSENIIAQCLNIPQVRFEKIVNLPGKVTEVHLTLKPETYRCSECGCKVTETFGSRLQKVRDLGIFENKTYLVFYKFRVKCPKCGVKAQALPSAEKYSRCTTRFEDFVARLCRITSVKAVAELLELDWKTVKEIDKRYLKKEFGKIDCSDLRVIAVDEIASKKGHNYFTLVLDLNKTRVVWVGKGRAEETLNQFFKEVGDKISNQIKAIAVDMWDPYLKSIRKCAPQAQPVFDKFHVIQAYSRVINVTRNAEYRRATEKGKDVIKGTKFILLKKKSDLSGFEKGRLSELLRLNRRLAKVYILKDELKGLWMYHYRAAAEKHLNNWIRMARRSRIKALRQFAKTLNRYRDGILAHCHYPINSGVLEGCNNKIKVMKRVAYGFHDDEYFMLKIKQACSGTTYNNTY